MNDSTHQELEAAHEFAVNALSKNASSSDVVNQLVAQGLTEIEAIGVVRGAIKTAFHVPPISNKDEGISDLKIGSGALVIALFISFLSYGLAAARGGGRYFIGFGLGLVAIFYISRGLLRVIRR